MVLHRDSARKTQTYPSVAQHYLSRRSAIALTSAGDLRARIGLRHLSLQLLVFFSLLGANAPLSVAAPGVSITQSGGTTNVNETGPTSDTYVSMLDAQPTASVEIIVHPDTQTELGAGTGAPILLTFTTGDWNVAQIVTVTAVDDAVVEGAHASTITHTASSADPGYNGIAIFNVVASVTDNDTAGVIITQSGGSINVNENGPTSDSYDIVLRSKPSASVTIVIQPDGQVDLGSGPGTALNLVISPSSWNFPRQIIVTAVDDTAQEGPHISTITHAATSADPDYNAIAISNVVSNITDNDAAGVSITQSNGSTNVSEQGPTSDAYVIVLDKQAAVPPFRWCSQHSTGVFPDRSRLPLWTMRRLKDFIHQR